MDTSSRILAIVLLVSAVAGCLDADFKIRIQNLTDAPVQVTVEIVDESGSVVFNETRFVEPNANVDLGAVKLDEGDYQVIARSHGGIGRGERHFSDSLVSIIIKLRVEGPEVVFRVN